MTFASLFTDAEEETRCKRLFAEALLRMPGKALNAAREVFGANMGRALFAAQFWLTDEQVLEHQTRLLDEAGGERAFLPSKEVCARSIWEKAHDARTSVEEYTRLMELYAKLMSYLERPAPAAPGGGTVVLARNVLMVPIAATEQQWESGAMAQQAALATLGDSVTDAVIVDG
jgi:hypothetical protein